MGTCQMTLFIRKYKLPANQRKSVVTLCVTTVYGAMFSVKLDTLTVLLADSAPPPFTY
jgi:hypothetical protein